MAVQESTPDPRQVTVLGTEGTEPLLPPRAGCTPILKWVGSKRWLAPTLAPSIYERLTATKGRYIEPFLGGASIALDLGLPGMILADTCKPLIALYRQIQKTPGAVAWALQTLVERGTDKDSYLAVRASEPPSVVFAAARFIYLNKFGFNGLYRENANGKFNVPHGGDRSSAKLPDAAALEAIAQAFKGADLNVADFRVTIARAQANDVVYADSPYYETFSGYTAGGFNEDDHFELAQALTKAHNRGAVVVASNSDHERIHELYAWARIVPVSERHTVGATAERRGLRPAVLIISDAAILRGVA